MLTPSFDDAVQALVNMKKSAAELCAPHSKDLETYSAYAREAGNLPPPDCFAVYRADVKDLELDLGEDWDYFRTGTYTRFHLRCKEFMAQVRARNPDFHEAVKTAM